MKYILDHKNEANRLERQAQSSLYHPNTDLEGLKIQSGLRVLDAGCGSGALARVIAERFPGAQVFGMDASSDRIEQAKKLMPQNGPKVDYRVGNLTSQLGGTYDRIVCRYVIEHLSDADQQAVANHLTQALSPNGFLRLIDIDGGLLNIHPRTPLLNEGLNILESKRVIDFFAGRKLPKLLVDAGLDTIEWKIQPMVMNEVHVLAEEVRLIEERFEQTLPLMTEVFGSKKKASAFQKEYLEVLESPGTTLFYNKFIATGQKSVSRKRNHLRSVQF